LTGEGAFAKVKAATHIATGVPVAVKIIDKTKITEDYVWRNLHREGELMKRLRHPHVIRLFEIVETERLYCLVTETAEGGEVLDYIVAHGSLSERETRKFVRQLVSAVHHMHSQNIIHR
jgi:serine/threonine protein kinase